MKSKIYVDVEFPVLMTLEIEVDNYDEDEDMDDVLEQAEALGQKQMESLAHIVLIQSIIDTNIHVDFDNMSSWIADKD